VVCRISVEARGKHDGRVPVLGFIREELYRIRLLGLIIDNEAGVIAARHTGRRRLSSTTTTAAAPATSTASTGHLGALPLSVPIALMIALVIAPRIQDSCVLLGAVERGVRKNT
jgi:hypothetical protein